MHRLAAIIGFSAGSALVLWSFLRQHSTPAPAASIPLCEGHNPATVRVVTLPTYISRRQYEELVEDGYAPGGRMHEYVMGQLRTMIDGEPVGV